MVSVLQIHVTQSPGDILVFLTGQVSAIAPYRRPKVCCVLCPVDIECTFIAFQKTALVYCRMRLRRVVSFCRRGVEGSAQRSLS